MGKFLYAQWLIRPTIGKLQNLYNMNPCSTVHRCKIWSLPIAGRVLNLLWRAGHFKHKSFIPTHPLHQSGILFMV
jgi:hypothetical protein